MLNKDPVVEACPSAPIIGIPHRPLSYLTGTKGDCLYAEVKADNGLGVDFEIEPLNVCVIFNLSESL